MGRLSWIIPEGPKGHHECPYTREAEGDLTQKGRSPHDRNRGKLNQREKMYTAGLEDATRQGTQVATRIWKREGGRSTPEPPGAADTLILTL